MNLNDKYYKISKYINTYRSISIFIYFLHKNKINAKKCNKINIFVFNKYSFVVLLSFQKNLYYLFLFLLNINISEEKKKRKL